MLKQASLFALLVALAACTGSSPNPVNGNQSGGDDDDGGDGPGGGTPPEIAVPADILQNIENVTFDAGDPNDPTDDVIVVTGLAGDGSPVDTTYSRNPALDVQGYQAFAIQDDRLDPIYIGMAATADDGSVRAVAVSDGGQFNRFFRGAAYERLTPLTRPAVTDDNGQVSYAGFYAGVTNLDAVSNDQRIPLQPGDPQAAEPRQSRQTEGRVFINVDFSDNQVRGTIYDRQFTDGLALPDLTLVDADLDEEGQFTGVVEFAGDPGQGTQGTHGGIIGGTDASGLAGGVNLTNLFNPNDPTTYTPEAQALDSGLDNESGVFVLPRCGTPTAPAICNGLGDLN